MSPWTAQHFLPCNMLPASSELSGHFVGHNIV